MGKNISIFDNCSPIWLAQLIKALYAWSAFINVPEIYLHRQFVDFQKSINSSTVLIKSDL